MTPVLTPELALAYLGSLWVDLRGGAVLGSDGVLLSGDRDLGDAARALLLASPDGVVRSAPRASGVLYAARSGAHGIAVLVGPGALEAVLVSDLRSVLDDLNGC